MSGQNLKLALLVSIGLLGLWCLLRAGPREAQALKAETAMLEAAV